jgi:hypothetical protein
LGPGEPYWGNGYTREAVAVVIDYGLRSLGMATIRAYTDPSNRALQKNSIAMRPQKGQRNRTYEAHLSRRTACTSVPHLAAGARTMNATMLQSRSGTLRLLLRRIRIIQCNAPFCLPGDGRDPGLHRHRPSPV